MQEGKKSIILAGNILTRTARIEGRMVINERILLSLSFFWLCAPSTSRQVMEVIHVIWWFGGRDKNSPLVGGWAVGSFDERRSWLLVLLGTRSTSNELFNPFSLMRHNCSAAACCEAVSLLLVLLRVLHGGAVDELMDGGGRTFKEAKVNKQRC